MNNIQKINKDTPLFHGELTVTPVPYAPKGTVTKYKKYIAAHSETGHHHVLECDAEFDQIMTDNGIYIRLYVEAKLFHDKSHDIHETKILQPGVYLFGEKTEYSPWTKAIQRVFD